MCEAVETETVRQSYHTGGLGRVNKLGDSFAELRLREGGEWSMVVVYSRLGSSGDVPAAPLTGRRKN